MKLVAPKNTGSERSFPINNDGGLCPQETAVMTIVAIKETEGVERPKYGNPNETEKLNVIRILFGREIDGKQYFAQTKEFRQSASPKSALMGFLTSLLGRAPAVDGSFDTNDLIGQGATVTISHQTTQRGTTYAQVSGVGPVLANNLSEVKNPKDFTIPGSESESQSNPY